MPLNPATLRAHTALVIRQSENSLADYLGHVVIDARPEPVCWGQCIEPWQQHIVEPMLPAIEHLAGLRCNYTGPRSFLYVLPRGHDKTGVIGRLCNWVIAFARQPINAVAAASTQEQAAILLDSMKAELRLNSWLQSRLKPRNYMIQGPGGKLRVIAADANHSSGLKCDLIVCDELTFWAKRDLFDVLYSGREKRPESVFIVITNAGLRGSWQWDLLCRAKSEPRHWHVFEAPLGRTLASWMTAERIAAVRAMIPSSHARRVLDNAWIDATEHPLLSWELIQPCVADCLWPDGTPPRGHRPELYLGVDVGRTRDRTVIWTAELVGDVVWTREIKVLEGQPFAVQKSEIISRLNRHVVALRIDQGAIGYQLAEELETEYPGIVEGVQLTAGRQGQLALALKTAFESARIRIPADPVLAADLQLVEEVATGTSGVPTLETHHGPSGHADRFWAAALALSGLPLQRTRSPGVARGRQPRM